MQRIFFRAALLTSTTPAQLVEHQIDWNTLRLAVRAQLRAMLGLDP